MPLLVWLEGYLPKRGQAILILLLRLVDVVIRGKFVPIRIRDHLVDIGFWVCVVVISWGTLTTTSAMIERYYD
jgi:hypothetical protein